MIDILTLVITMAVLGYIIFRAVVLDRTLPWFRLAEDQKARANRGFGNNVPPEEAQEQDMAPPPPSSVSSRRQRRGHTGAFRPRLKGKQSP